MILKKKKPIKAQETVKTDDGVLNWVKNALTETVLYGPYSYLPENENIFENAYNTDMQYVPRYNQMMKTFDNTIDYYKQYVNSPKFKERTMKEYNYGVDENAKFYADMNLGDLIRAKDLYDSYIKAGETNTAQKYLDRINKFSYLDPSASFKENAFRERKRFANDRLSTMIPFFRGLEEPVRYKMASDDKELWNRMAESGYYADPTDSFAKYIAAGNAVAVNMPAIMQHGEDYGIYPWLFPEILGHEVDHGIYAITPEKLAEYIAQNRKNVEDEHDEDPEETRADINGVRYMLYNLGIYNPMTEDMTEETYDKIEKALGNQSHEFNRLRRLYDKKFIIWLFNNLAKNERRNGQEETYYV